MTAGEPLNLLVQAGLVGVFMVFVILTRRDDARERKEREESWKSFMQLQNDSLCQNLESLTNATEKLIERFTAHERKVDEGFAILLDRIRPGARGKSTQ